MSAYANQTDESYDPRPRHFTLGVDEHGAHHVYATRAHRVDVVRDGRRELAQDLGDRSIEEWMGFVDARRGWGDRHYYQGFVESIAAALGGDR